MGRVHLIQNVADVGGVQLGDFLMGDFQLQRLPGVMGRQGFNIVPGNQSVGRFAEMQHLADTVQDAVQPHSAQQAAYAGVHANQRQPSTGQLFKSNIVDPDNPVVVNVHDLLV